MGNKYKIPSVYQYSTTYPKPITGNVGVIYVDKDTNVAYRWDSATSNYIPLETTVTSIDVKGTWDALNNVPALSSGSGASGDLYVVSVANDAISPAIDGITSVAVGDWMLANATAWQKIPAINTVNPPIIVTSTQPASNLDTTYLVDTSAGDVTLTVPLSDATNESRYMRFIKTTSDSNSVIIKPTLPQSFGGDAEYQINYANESIGLQSTGSAINGWIKIQDSRSDRPIKTVEFLGEENVNILEDENWKIEIVGNSLVLYRRENGAWIQRSSFGSSLTTDRFIIENNSGSVVFIDSLGGTNTLVKPSIDENGGVIGNPIGRIALIHNGELFSVEFDAENELQNIIQNQITETQTGTEFEYQFITTQVESVISGIMSLNNVLAGTKVRVSFSSLDGVLLTENVSQFDFNSGQGELVADGINTIALRESLALSQGFQFKFKLQTSNSIDIQGKTVDLGDGLGSRFIPYLTVNYYLGEEQNVTRDKNVIAQIEAKTGADKLSFNALKDVPTDITDLSTHSATELNDITNVGSGVIISDAERTKLEGIATGAEENVQSDWNQASAVEDDYIKNKPNDITDLALHNVTELSDVTSEGSGAIITDEERTKLENISDNGTGDHWVSGLQITEHSPKDQTVNYGNGTYLINGLMKTILTGGTYDLENGYGSVNHYSGLTSYQHALVGIYVDADLVIKSIAGTPAEKKDIADLPIIPVDSVCLAVVEIKVDNGANPKDIGKKQIEDCRTNINYGTDEFVKASADDTSTGHLIDKLSNNGNVTFTIENAGGDERIKADVSNVISDRIVARRTTDQLFIDSEQDIVFDTTVSNYGITQTAGVFTINTDGYYAGTLEMYMDETGDPTVYIWVEVKPNGGSWQLSNDSMFALKIKEDSSMLFFFKSMEFSAGDEFRIKMKIKDAGDTIKIKTLSNNVGLGTIVAYPAQINIHKIGEKI